jgi:hypothetical protein
MAVGIGERLTEGHRRLWLFRNKFRSIWIVDMRRYLGQIFFCSTPEIWQSAAQSCREVRTFIRKKIKLIELPPEEIWVMECSDQKPVVENAQVRKFDVFPQGYHTFEYTGSPIGIPKNKPVAEVYTKLDEDDVVNRQQDSSVKKNNIVTGRAGRSFNGTMYTGDNTSNPNTHSNTNNNSIGRVGQQQSDCHRTATPPKINLLGTGGNSHSAGRPLDKFSTVTPGRGGKGVIQAHGTTYAATQSARTGGKASPQSDFTPLIGIAGSGSKDIDLFKKDDDDRDLHDFETFARGIKLDPTTTTVEETDDAEDNMDIESVVKKCRELREIITNIETNALNKRLEGSLTFSAFAELMTTLEQTSLEMKGALIILDS